MESRPVVVLSMHAHTHVRYCCLLYSIRMQRKSRVDLDDLSLSVEHNLQALQECTGATSVADIVMVRQ